MITFEDAGVDDAIGSDADALGVTEATPFLTSRRADTTLDMGIYFPVRVGDFVWEDLDSDGLQGIGEPGVSNVTVVLFDGMTNAVATNVTDASGAYLFTNLPPGVYAVDFDESTIPVGSVITLEDVGADETVDSDADALGVTEPTTFLTSGQSDTNLDMGIYFPVSVGDFVWEDVDGDGLQDPGEPGVSNVMVVLLDAMANAIATNVTDALGAYLFTGLPPGVYTVDFDESTIPAGGESIDYVDFGYAPRPGTIGNLVFVDANMDGLFNPADGDVGVVGVTVNLYDDMTNVIAAVMTDINGNYLFLNVPPGTFFVDVDNGTLAPGLSVGPLGTPGVDNNSQGQLYAVTLGMNDANLTADFGYIFSGEIVIGDTVYYDWNNNGTQDGTDTPIEGIELDLYVDVNSDGLLDAGDILLTTDVTDTNGNYLFTGLIPTNYIVEIIDSVYCREPRRRRERTRNRSM